MFKDTSNRQLLVGFFRHMHTVLLRYSVCFAILIEDSMQLVSTLPLFFSPRQAFYSPRPDFPIRWATILTRTTTREIKRDKGRQTWRVTYGVKCGDKNEKLRCQVIYFYATVDIFARARVPEIL